MLVWGKTQFCLLYYLHRTHFISDTFAHQKCVCVFSHNKQSVTSGECPTVTFNSDTIYLKTVSDFTSLRVCPARLDTPLEMAVVSRRSPGWLPTTSVWLDYKSRAFMTPYRVQLTCYSSSQNSGKHTCKLQMKRYIEWGQRQSWALSPWSWGVSPSFYADMFTNLEAPWTLPFGDFYGSLVS